MKGIRRASVLLLLVFGGLATATTWRQLDLGEMFKAAEIAVHAVVDSVSEESVDGEPWTRVTFAVRTGLAWPAEEEDPDARWQDPPRITLAFLGGTAAGATLNAALLPSFSAGDEVLLLAYTGPFYSPIVGVNQALWWLSDGEWRDREGRVLDLDDSGEPVLGPGGVGAAADEVVEAVKSLLEAR